MTTKAHLDTFAVAILIGLQFTTASRMVVFTAFADGAWAFFSEGLFKHCQSAGAGPNDQPRMRLTKEVVE